METSNLNSHIPLIVIVGPTASGKTSLSIDLAEKYNGEIICADSRTIYSAIDIGTAKPTLEQRARVPHWGLDIVAPGEQFTVADFKRYTEQKILEIRGRGNVPFLVGGTGLYVDGVVFNYQFGPAPNHAQREKLEQMDIVALIKYCVQHNIQLPENKTNKRYVIRAIEQKSINTKRSVSPIDNTFIVGIATDNDILRTRMQQRIEQLFDDGVVEEAIKLGKMYGWNTEALTGNIYPLVRLYLAGQLSLSEIKEKAVTADWRLAKRQMTWFKRNKYIVWKSLAEAEHYLSDILARSASS